MKYKSKWNFVIRKNVKGDEGNSLRKKVQNIRAAQRKERFIIRKKLLWS